MTYKKIGENVPKNSFKILTSKGLSELNYKTIFENKRVVVFALPGAFTPTCSSKHLPDYERLHSVFKENGIDDIYCVSVNDPFVMDAWAKDQGAKNVKLLPDGNAEFTDGMGLLVDKSDLGFGPRSWRYAMVVNNGVIEDLFIEPSKPGDPFEVSDAQTVLDSIAPNANKPKRVTLFTKANCIHCSRAKELLASKGYEFEEVYLGGNGLSLSTLSAVTGRDTTPQVYIDGEHIGGADELENYFS